MSCGVYRVLSSYRMMGAFRLGAEPHARRPAAMRPQPDTGRARCARAARSATALRVH